MLETRLVGEQMTQCNKVRHLSKDSAADHIIELGYLFRRFAQLVPVHLCVASGMSATVIRVTSSVKRRGVSAKRRWPATRPRGRTNKDKLINKSPRGGMNTRLT